MKNIVIKEKTKLTVRLQGFIQALSLMSIWLKKIEFDNKKSNCEAIVIVAWGLRQSSGVVSGG